MRPRDVVQAWIDAFNRADVGALSALYHADAVNHQVAESPVEGREAIRAMFAAGFAAAEMVCIPENLFEDGERPSSNGATRKGCAAAGSSTSIAEHGREAVVRAALLLPAGLPILN
jgi:hypothetical protein